MKKQYYIGISSTFHDPSISIVDQFGEVIFAESTERHLQYKRAMGCPADPVVWSDKILNKYCDTDAEFHIATTWSSSYRNILQLFNVFGKLEKMPRGISKALFDKVFKTMLPDSNLIWFLQKQLASNIQAGISIERNLRWNYHNSNIKRYRFNHHSSHAAFAAYSSNLADATCLVVDGIGELGSISYFEYRNNKITQKGYHKGFESLGFFYTLITFLCGFDSLEGEEWKVMGMAPYGKIDSNFYQSLDSILEVRGCNVKLKNDGKYVLKILESIKANLNQHNNCFEKRADLAYTGQFLFSQYMNCLLDNLYKKGMSDNLVYSGGCALNSSFNGEIISKTNFKKLYVPPAPGDDGNSLGAAWMAFKKNNPDSRLSNKILSPYLGSTISDKEVDQFIKFSGHKKVQHYPGTIHLEAAKLLAEGKLVGWIQGRAEFGPRALGNRSILADPRSENMKDWINERVKFREEFRPFAPSVLAEFGEEFFEDYQESPYMERTLRFRDNVISKIPAVVHINQTGRLQTVKREWNEKYYDLIYNFYEITGIPLLLNTSFNVMGKPIIHSFNDALIVFFNSGLDALVVNDFIIKK